ncbi:aquaporin-like protein [Decorospora gaudefroyi]|uniref:Aquaporin-like protein n=1 Tax=Decorospora gaudefroyi TaxID=184978 RepID=A0A6A5KGR6_9PLEO|nr:aquaporin-like protein [Decorospora gaudefroyi]
MAQANSSLPQYYGQQLQDGTMIESSVVPPIQRGSSDSRQELLRLPIHPHPAHLDFHMEPEPPTLPVHQSNTLALSPKTSNARRVGGRLDLNEWNAPNRARRQSNDVRSVPYSPATHRTPYVEDYSEEDEDPRAYRHRPSRRHQRPPISYNNYMDQSSRYGPLPRNSVDTNTHPAYTDTPGKPNYEMYYPSDDEHARRRPGMAGGRGPPRQPPPESVMRLPWAIWMGSNAKNHFVAFIGEFVGTTMFLFFAFSGTQVANIGSNASPSANTTTGAAAGFSPIVLLYIALVFAFSLMVNVWVFFRISGGLFNPAVTFAMLLCRALSPTRAFLLLAAQISGSIFASFLVSVLFPTEFNVRTTLGEGTSLAQGVFIEAVLTAELVFTIFMLAKEKHKATFIAPVGIGLALFIAELVGVYYTGGSLNPARSFGPCVVTGVFDIEHWIYWVGPAAGAIIAVVFYKFIKILEYEVANPGQDDDDKDQEVKEEMEKKEWSVEPDVERAAAGPARHPREGQGFGGRGEATY